MKTLRNATTALSVIAESPCPVSVGEIGDHLGLPRSSASRLLSSLRDGGLIEQDPLTRHYRPGALAWRLGVGFRPAGHDLDLLTGAMTALSQSTGFTCWMAVLDRTRIVLLRQHQGRTPAHFSVRLGQTLPAHTTAVGKALLARLPDRGITDLYGETLSQETRNSLHDRAELIENIRIVRERGYAVSRQETFPGVVAVGATIHGRASSCPIGLSLSFPAEMAESDRIARQLMDELAVIGRDLADPYWT